MGFYLALRLGLGLARALPPRMVIKIAGWMGRVIGPRHRSAGIVAENLDRIADWESRSCGRSEISMRECPPRPVDPGPVLRVQDVFASYGAYWGELLALSARPHLLSSLSIRIEGSEHLEQAMAAGPVCLLTGHLGNWDLGAAWATQWLRPFAVISEPLRPARLFNLFSCLRGRMGCTVFSAQGDGVSFYRHLRRGGHAGIVVDRALGSEGRSVPFMGGFRRFPASAVLLARRAGASLLPTFLLREDGGYVIKVHPALGGARDPIIGFARILECEITLRPEQWCVLYPLHDADERSAVLSRGVEAP
jgi:phosphatidylinositol dimannoside acyltransferase